MEGFTPGRNGGGGGADCVMRRDHCCQDHVSGENKQFILAASGDFRHSMRIRQEVGSHLRTMVSLSKPFELEPPNGRVYPVEAKGEELADIVLRSGWNEFVSANDIEEDYSILFMYHGNSRFKVHIFDSSGHEKSSCSQPPSGVFGAVPPSDHYVLNEQVVPDPGHVQSSTDIVYTMLPGCRLTKAQDKKVLEIADTTKSEIPLHVAVMNKRNINLKDPCVFIPLQLVLDHFKDKITKPNIRLEAPDNNIYSVGASKHNCSLVVLDAGWDTFVASNHVQENDLLIFRSTEKSRLEVLILDPNGPEKISSCSVMGNRSSTAQETCDDSIQILNPPSPQIFDMTISDEDDITREGTREFCRAQKRVTRRCAKAQKMASTSSPSTKSGYGAREPHDRASVKLGASSEPLSNNLGGPSQQPYMLSKGTTLTMQVEKKVEALVQEIQSKLPIFVQVMTIKTVDRIGRSSPCIMNFCAEFASACLPGKRRTLVLKLEGKTKEWKTKLNIRSKNCMTRIYIGWKEFATDNGLEVGDICLFQLVDTSIRGFGMKVHLIRKSEIEL